MPLKGILFSFLFIACATGALLAPYLGIYGYMADYLVGTGYQWWAAPLKSLGVRFAFTFIIVTAIGSLLKFKQLKFGTHFLKPQEIWIILFLLAVWFLSFLGEESVGRYAISDHPTVKLTKIVVFGLMMTHLITDRKKLTYLIWVLVIGSLYLGLEAWSTPYSSFTGGRLEGIGGPDFRDANRFGGFMAGMLFIIGAQFLRSGWYGKLLCFLSGGFTANAIILTRSRGAILGVAVGMLVLFVSIPNRYRMGILVAMIVCTMGIYYLSDPESRSRSATVTATAENRDRSAQGRLEVWAAGYKMFVDNLIIGVGPGNFYQNIGYYNPQVSGKDAHNTIIRCIGELGLVGLLLYGIIVSNASLIFLKFIRQVTKESTEINKNYIWISIGLLCCLGAMFGYGMTGTLLYTEYLWWMLFLPVCIQRSYENETFES